MHMFVLTEQESKNISHYCTIIPTTITIAKKNVKVKCVNLPHGTDSILIS